jgi:hypothetical protein
MAFIDSTTSMRMRSVIEVSTPRRGDIPAVWSAMILSNESG